MHQRASDFAGVVGVRACRMKGRGGLVAQVHGAHIKRNMARLLATLSYLQSRACGFQE
jgi:hypothetical protein